jgi:hypothetical protein
VSYELLDLCVILLIKYSTFTFLNNVWLNSLYICRNKEKHTIIYDYLDSSEKNDCLDYTNLKDIIKRAM